MVAFERWCIFLEDEKIQCHDTDTKTRHLLYNGTALRMEFWFSGYTKVDNDGRWVYLLLAGQYLCDLM